VIGETILYDTTLLVHASILKHTKGYISLSYQQYLCSRLISGPPTIRWHSNGHYMCSFIGTLIFIFLLLFAYDTFFSKRSKLLTNKLMLQSCNESRLKSSFRKLYGPYIDLVCDYKLPLAHMLDELFHTIC
jgi:hypothetical protein